MNTEEKAKAYDEALERARKMLDMILNNELLGFPGQIREIFPELRESEDERIRVRLIEYFKGFLEGFEDCYKDGGDVKWEGLDVKSILAWLEKQKGKMTAEEFESSELFQLKLKTKYANGYQDGIVQQQEKQKEPENTSASTMIPSCWEVEQKEQKEIPLMNGDTDLYFDEWNQQHSNPTKRECFEAGMLYAVRLLTEDSPMLEEFKKGLEQVILWAKEGYKVSPDGTTKTLTQDEIDGVLDEQKEQKHPDGCFTCDEYKKGYEEGRRNGFTAGYNKAMKEVEQKEQKPTENEKVEITDFEQSVYDLCPVLGIEEAKATASDLLELAKKTLLKTGKVVLASNYPEGCSFEDGFHLGYNEGFNAKQKEQKPAEKQDYSGLSNLERVIHRGFLAADLEDVPVTIIKETAKECVAQMKPAEWDDYTKINLGRAIQIIKDARGTLHGYQTDDGIYECDKAIEALEHFLYRGLEIEKSAEWSEEDEEMLNSCISSIEEAKENRYAYKETDGDTSYDHEIDWLKSLRPSWKPSKEQMESLRDTIINTKGYSYSVYLPELYEQLKKLR